MAKENTSETLKRVSTGIDGLDAFLQGGFLPGRSYLVTGDAGTGKTTACVQYLKSGLELGEKAVYVTVDERPAEILQAAESLGWDLQPHVQEKSFAILDASPYFSGRGVAGDKGVDLQKIVSDLAIHEKSWRRHGRLSTPSHPDSIRRFADPRARTRSNVDSLAPIKSLHHKSHHLAPSAASKPQPTNGIEEFLAAGVLILRVIQDSERPVRTLSVRKIRGTAIEPSEYAFSIVKEHGIFILSQDKKSIPIVTEEPGFQGLEFFQLPKE